jgi:hypothetical protein
MPTHDLAPYRNPLDLLSRFAPTPLKASVDLGFARIELETNDLSFLPAPLASASASLSVTNAGNGDGPFASCLWKIIRDPDVHHPLAEPSFLNAGNLAVCTMGPACLIAADRGRKELLAFIGAEVDARTFQKSILPILCRFTEFATSAPSVSLAKTEDPVAVGDEYNA